MENTNIKYQFTPIPTQLMLLCDLNCRSMLFTLVQLSTYYSNEEGEFFRSNEDLQQEALLSQKLVLATCSALHRVGVITVRSVGKGKGKHANYYRVNTEAFKAFEAFSMDDLKKPELRIYTDNYKEHNYVPSYLSKGSNSVTLELPPSTNNIENTENTESTENTVNENTVNTVITEDVINTSLNNNMTLDKEEKSEHIKENTSTAQAYSEEDYRRVVATVFDKYVNEEQELEEFKEGLKGVYTELASTNWVYYTRFKQEMRQNESREHFYNPFRELIEHLNETYSPAMSA